MLLAPRELCADWPIARAQQDAAFRQELMTDPKAVFARELGVTMPDSIQVAVLEETPSKVYLVLPKREVSPPRGGTGMNEEQ